MNQEKIGKFIAEKRKSKNLTQEEFAEKLGVSSKSVSRWENGKCMPDLSLLIPISKELDISINELMSGEILSQEEYLEKSEENIVKVVDNVKKLEKKKKKLLILLSITLVLIFLYILYRNILLIEKPLRYDNRVMKCHFENNVFLYEFQTSIAHITKLEVELENEKIIFINAKLAIKNRKRYNFEVYQNMANLADRKEGIFSAGGWIDINENDKVKVYYTEKSLDKINKNDKEKLKDIIKKSNLMCENN